MAKDKNVTFIRKGGKIIPIRKRNKKEVSSKKVFAGIGAASGIGAGISTRGAGFKVTAIAGLAGAGLGLLFGKGLEQVSSAIKKSKSKKIQKLGNSSP